MATDTALVDVEGVLELVEEINGLVAEYKDNTEQAKEIHKKLLTMPWGQVTREDLSTRLETIQKQNRRIAGSIRDLIKKGDGLKVEQESVKREKLSSASVWLQNAMMEYNNEVIQYQDKAKDNLVKAIQITGTELTRDQISHKIDSGEVNTDIFTQSIIQDTAEASRQLEEVNHRHKEMLNLEDSLRELSSLMEEVKQLVAGHQVRVDHVECNIQEAGYNVQEGVSFLNRAVKLKEKVRQNKTLVLGALSSLAIILIIIIAASARSSSQPSPQQTIIITENSSSVTVKEPLDNKTECDGTECVIDVICTQEFPLPCHPQCPEVGPFRGKDTARCECEDETCYPNETCTEGRCTS